MHASRPTLALMTKFSIFLLALLLFSTLPQAARAQGACQDINDPACAVTRAGLGVSTVLSAQNGFGLGLRGRVAARINRDFSGAVDIGFVGFILRGRDQATIIFDPQVSGIISFEPQGDTQAYILGGIGAFVPLTNAQARQSGPSIHFGIGQARELQDSVLYLEVDPTIVVGATAVEFTLPLRMGLIFNGGNTTRRPQSGERGVFNR